MSDIFFSVREVEIAGVLNCFEIVHEMNGHASHYFACETEDKRKVSSYQVDATVWHFSNMLYNHNTIFIIELKLIIMDGKVQIVQKNKWLADAMFICNVGDCLLDMQMAGFFSNNYDTKLTMVLYFSL